MSKRRRSAVTLMCFAAGIMLACGSSGSGKVTGGGGDGGEDGTADSTGSDSTTGDGSGGSNSSGSGSGSGSGSTSSSGASSSSGSGGSSGSSSGTVSPLVDGGDAGSDAPGPASSDGEPPEAATDGDGACVPARNASWSWVLLSGGGPNCPTCAQAQCCDALTTCDDGALDPTGFSPCGEDLKCIVQYVTGAGAFRDGSADASPDFDAATSACSGFANATGQANAEAVLGCIQTDCSSQCSLL